MHRDLIRAAILAGAVSAATEAAFVSLEVEAMAPYCPDGNVYYVYRWYAKFNNANDTVLNVYGMNATPTGLFWHNDFLSGGQFSNTDGTWSPTLMPAGNAAFDSWVTVGGNAGDFGNSTAADPNWGAAGWNTPGIAANAGWFNQNPPNLQGRVNGTTLRTLIGQFVYRNLPVAWTTSVTIGFNQGLGTPAQFATASFAVPTPGVLPLLALGCLTGTRRRR